MRPTTIGRVSFASKQICIVHGPDPAQRSGRWNSGSDAQAGNRDAPPFKPCGVKIEQHVPRRIGEQLAWKMLVTHPSDANGRAHRASAGFGVERRIGAIARPIITNPHRNRRRGQLRKHFCEPCDFFVQQAKSFRLSLPRYIVQSATAAFAIRPHGGRRRSHRTTASHPCPEVAMPPHRSCLGQAARQSDNYVGTIAVPASAPYR